MSGGAGSGTDISFYINVWIMLEVESLWSESFYKADDQNMSSQLNLQSSVLYVCWTAAEWKSNGCNQHCAPDDNGV